MPDTVTDGQFKARFPDMEATTFVANHVALNDYVPTQSPINNGMLSDIGRATVYGADIQGGFFGRFMRTPLSRGNAALKSAVMEVGSRVYNPNAPDADLFNGDKPGFYTDVAVKNFSRQIAVEMNDYILKQYVQTPEMIGDAAAAIMGTSYACYIDDMWVAFKEFISGSTRDAKTGQMVTLTENPADAGFADAMTEALWAFSQNKFGYKSDKYNPTGRNTKSESVSVILKKDVEFPTFKKLYSETFNPEMLRIAVDSIDYVDDFATPAGKPVSSGELLGMVIDNRTFDIIPMPDTLTTESFRNPARKSTAYFTTYEYAFQASPFFNVGYIFGPAGA